MCIRVLPNPSDQWLTMLQFYNFDALFGKMRVGPC
jgi:hypothetical protein